MKKTGELLKNAREEKKLSLHEIGLSLKINSKILKAIEEGDLEQLPAKTFLRGFVQSYAQYLKLNPQQVLKLFADEMGSTRPEVSIETTAAAEQNATATASATSSSSSAQAQALPTVKPAPTIRKDSKEKPLSEERNYKNGMVIGLVAVLLGLILLTKRVVDRYQKEAEIQSSAQEVIKEPLPADSPTEEMTAKPEVLGPHLPPGGLPVPTTNTAQTTPSPTAAAATTKPVIPAPAPVAAKPTPPPTAPILAAKPVTPPAAPAPAPAAKPAPKPEVKADSSKTETPAATADAAKPVEKEKNLELIIEALDNVEVELTNSQGKVEKLKLAAEQIHRFKTKSGVKLNVNNGGAVNIILNGKDVGVPGVLGQPIKLTY